MIERPGNGSPVDEWIDPELARLYRESAREEPPAGLDAAILAAARREAEALSRVLAPQTGEVASSHTAPRASGPGPQVDPRVRPFRRAWRLPVSLAAVMVLSISVVTLMMEQDSERPAEPLRSTPEPVAEGARTPKLRSPTVPALPGESASERALHDRRDVIEPDTTRQGKALERPDAARRSALAAAPARDKAAVEETRAFSGPPMPQSAAPVAEASPTTASSPPALAREYAHEPPEKWGEKIVELRRQGRSAEADELLAEFKRRFPGHAVPAEWMP